MYDARQSTRKVRGRQIFAFPSGGAIKQIAPHLLSNLFSKTAHVAYGAFHNAESAYQLPHHPLEVRAMFNLMTQNWWAIALRGLVAVLFGIATFMWPHITLRVLAPLFGVYALINGIFAVIEAFRRDVSRERWPPLLFEGAVSILVGFMTLTWPGLTAIGLLFLIAFWAIVTGVFEIITAIKLRHEIRGEWMMALIAILSMAFGLLLLAFPVTGALSVILIIRAFVFAIGALMIALALKLRSLRRPGGEAPHVGHAAPSH